MSTSSGTAVCINCGKTTAESARCFGQFDHELRDPQAPATEHDEGCYHCGLGRPHTIEQHLRAVA